MKAATEWTKETERDALSRHRPLPRGCVLIVTRKLIHGLVRAEDLFPDVCRISKQIFRAWKESIAVLCKFMHPVCTVKAGKDYSILLDP